MSHLEPGEALRILEQSLRLLLERVLGKRLGPTWLEQVTTGEQRARWAAVAEEEMKKRGKRGVAAVEPVGPAYMQLHELITLIDTYWSDVSPALGRQAQTAELLKQFERTSRALIGRFNDLRNTVGHSRALLPFEQDLLAGVAGQIRNQVTIFLSEQDSTGEYYPLIQRVADSFNNEAPQSQLAHPEGWANAPTGITLRPGDTVAFECSATDPHGRNINWWLSTDMGVPASEDQATLQRTGERVTLVWKVTDNDVGASKTILIYMAAATTPYHRRHHFDQGVSFTYRVDPPEHAARNEQQPRTGG